MKLSKYLLILSVLLFLYAPMVNAVEFICTNRALKSYAEAGTDIPQASAAVAGRSPHKNKITRVDLEQAYGGQPVLIGPTWLIVYMLPADTQETKEALGLLGINPNAAERMAKSASLVDRGIRLVRNSEEMLEKVYGNPPAAGFVQYLPGGFNNVSQCY